MPSVLLMRRTGTRLAAIRHRFPSGHPALLCLVLLCPLSCASNRPRQAFTSTRESLADLDEFGALLLRAGLPPEQLPPGRDLSAQEARRLRLQLHLYPLNPPGPGQYGPWRVADVLLLDAASRERPVSRVELGRRVQEFQSLVVLRPDGYLAEALTGKAERCVGPVEVQEDSYRSGLYELGAF